MVERRIRPCATSRRDSVSKSVMSTGLATDARIYTYSSNNIDLTQLYVSYGSNDGMFLQFDTNGGVSIFKVVDGIQEYVRSI